jgi:hypothetical protein
MPMGRNQTQLTIYVDPRVRDERAIDQLRREHTRSQELLRDLLKRGLADAIREGAIDPELYKDLDAEVLAGLQRYAREWRYGSAPAASRPEPSQPVPAHGKPSKSIKQVMSAQSDAPAQTASSRQAELNAGSGSAGNETASNQDSERDDERRRKMAKLMG